MEKWVTDLLEQSPSYGVILAIVYLGLKWHERISTQWTLQIKEITDSQERMSDKWLAAIQEIGEKCHDSHQKVSSLYYDQSCKVMESWTKLQIHLDHIARALEGKKP